MPFQQYAPLDETKPVNEIELSGYRFSVQRTPDLFAVVDIRRDEQHVPIHDVPVQIRAALTKMMMHPEGAKEAL